MTYKKDTKLTFDVSGNLASDGQVAVGCQMVPLTDLARVAANLSVQDGLVRATGVVGTADGDRKVTFEGTDRWFTESQIHDVARNLQTEEPAPVVPPSEWKDGDRVEMDRDSYRPGGQRLDLVRLRGHWYALNDETYAGWREVKSDFHSAVDGQAVLSPNRWFDYDREVDAEISRGRRNVVVLVKGGKPFSAEKPSTWQDGDRIRLDRTGHVRERRNGRWYTNGNSQPNDWYDVDYDAALARRPSDWTVLRKGGVDLAA
jgi:hypothetical protein